MIIVTIGRTRARGSTLSASSYPGIEGVGTHDSLVYPSLDLRSDGQIVGVSWEYRFDIALFGSKADTKQLLERELDHLNQPMLSHTLPASKNSIMISQPTSR